MTKRLAANQIASCLKLDFAHSVRLTFVLGDLTVVIRVRIITLVIVRIGHVDIVVVVIVLRRENVHDANIAFLQL